MLLVTSQRKKPAGKSGPTMSDVAKLAGVSAMTVSRALRQDGAVSERTRARVLEVIDEIGYVPDQAAGALSSGRSGLVAAIVPTLSNPLFSQVARGLDETLFQAGLQLFLGASDYSPEREEDVLKSLLRRRPEAIAIAGVGHTDRAARLLEGAGIPVIEFFDGANPPVDHVIAIDPAAVARATVAHLARKGRRRLGIVVARAQMDRRAAARQDALIEAARNAGLAPPAVFRHGTPTNPIDQGARGAVEAIESGSGVDALVFMNDYAAIGALTALRQRGVRVPEDIAVFGFGDCDVSRHVVPALTTISFNPAGAGVEIGKIMLSALDAARHGKSCPPYRLTLDFQIVERDSA